MSEGLTNWDQMTIAAAIGLFLLGVIAFRQRRNGIGRRTGLVAVAGLETVLLYATFLEPRWLDVHREVVQVPGWPIGKPITLALVSDIHIGPNGNAGTLSTLVATILIEKPDAVLLAGDFVHHPGEATYSLLSLLAPLKQQARLGVFGVLGNHDYAGPATATAKLRNVLTTAGVRLLFNDVTELVPGVALAGVDSVWAERADVARVVRQLPHQGLTIGLVHEPDAFPAMVDAGMPLILAGHTHGGQIRLPGFGALITVNDLVGRTDPSWMPRTHQSGWFERQGSRMYVTRGVGESGPRARLFCRPEITVLTLGR